MPTPFQALERLAEEVTRIFDGGSSPAPAPSAPMTWAPRADVTRHEAELVIRVDLPGVENNNVKMTVAEDAITIHGERHRAPEEERDVVYRTERNYGAFSRTIALPAGAITSQAQSSFTNGVFEIRMPAAPSADNTVNSVGEQK